MKVKKKISIFDAQNQKKKPQTHTQKEPFFEGRIESAKDQSRAQQQLISAVRVWHDKPEKKVCSYE